VHMAKKMVATYTEGELNQCQHGFWLLKYS
jgi:hypothetical protein